MDRGQYANVGAGALVGDSGDWHRGGHLDRSSDLSGGDPDDGEETDDEGAGALGPNCVTVKRGQAKARRTDAPRFRVNRVRDELK